ncbi:MAG: diaminopimelate epimerase [Wenzhouxiangella sp.]|nr:diaminopimelate epimerase [Wenzhouxiangella sp.]
MSSGQAFTKLEALGNDFVLLDHRHGQADPEVGQIRALGERRTGIGFDQLLVLHAATAPSADCRVHIYNRDGSPARQCGNGMRAIARWLEDEQPSRRRFLIDTPSGTVDVESLGDNLVRANMGNPEFSPASVGLESGIALDTLLQDLPGLQSAGLVSMGNPHLVLMLPARASERMINQRGRFLSAHAAFSAGINVSFAAVSADGAVHLDVYERGVGPTLACGSAACATAAFLIHEGQTTSPVRVDQPGGRLVIDWPGPDSPLWMTGPARRVFDGTLAT